MFFYAEKAGRSILRSGTGKRILEYRFGMFVLDAPLFKGAIDALNDDIEAGTIGDGNKINMDDGHSTIKYNGLAGY